MMSQPIGIKILKRYGLTTGRAAKSQSASRQTQKSHAHGEQKIPAGTWHIPVSPERLEMEHWSVSRVVDAEKKNQLLITKTMTNLWTLCGFVNHATNNDTKNLLKTSNF